MARELTDEDRARICIEFAVHAREIRANLNEFADTIAAGDTKLLAELFLIEEFLW